MSPQTFQVRFLDLGRCFSAAPDTLLMDLCEQHGLPLEAACGGFAACSTCRVCVVEGKLSPLDPTEEPFLDAPGQRLACQARIIADVALRLEPGA